jgi:hypothetical protein
MKQIKMKVLVITWSVLLIVSCTNPAKKNTSNVDHPKENQVVAVDTAIKSKVTSEVIEKEVIDGWLKESIKQQVVIDKIGNPEKKGEDVYLGATGTYAQTWEYPSLGINLEMESESQGGDKIVRSITITQPCKLTTSQGISIGSDAKIVREKYQKLIDGSNTDENGIVIGSIYGGTIFTLKDGSVSEIFIGAAAE